MTEDEFDPLPADMMRARRAREMRRGDAGDQTAGQKRDTIPACDRCGHPAIYHGRALPRCDACDCAGYLRPARTGVHTD